MHPFFDGLSVEETALLLTTLRTSGDTPSELFRFLPSETQTRLNEKVQTLGQMPEDARQKFILHEFRQVAESQGLRGIDLIDASWLVHALKGETPPVVAAALVGLPSGLARQVLKRLPSAIRKQLPSKSTAQRIGPPVRRIVRTMFEARLQPMPRLSTRAFGFREVLRLERAEIYRLMRDLGLVQLGQTFVAVGKIALTELCRRLPRSSAEELILAVRSASQGEVPSREAAQHFLSRVAVNFRDTEELFQKSGLWKLAQAAALEDEEVRIGFAQRLPREAGTLFLQFVEKADDQEENQEEAAKKLQDLVLARVLDLSKRHAIREIWQNEDFQWHFGPPEEISDAEPEPEDELLV